MAHRKTELRSGTVRRLDVEYALLLAAQNPESEEDFENLRILGNSPSITKRVEDVDRGKNARGNDPSTKPGKKIALFREARIASRRENRTKIVDLAAAFYDLLHTPKFLKSPYNDANHIARTVAAIKADSVSTKSRQTKSADTPDAMASDRDKPNDVTKGNDEAPKSSQACRRSGEFIAEAIEGMKREAKYLARGRNRQLRDTALENANGICEVCDRNFYELLGGRGARVLQVHHREQLSAFDTPTVTTLKGLAVVCANCHCLLHLNPQKALKIEDLKTMLSSEAYP